MLFDRQSKSERIEALSEEYRAGKLTPSVYKASLKALGLRHQEQEELARTHAPNISETPWEISRMEMSRAWLEKRLSRDYPRE